jgi:hypothetical protein
LMAISFARSLHPIVANGDVLHNHLMTTKYDR